MPANDMRSNTNGDKREGARLRYERIRDAILPHYLRQYEQGQMAKVDLNEQLELEKLG